MDLDYYLQEDPGGGVRRLLDAPGGEATPEIQRLLTAALAYAHRTGLPVPPRVRFRIRAAGGTAFIDVGRLMALSLTAPGLKIPPAAAGGATVWDADARSVEVVIDGDVPPATMAALVLHELMHVSDYTSGASRALTRGEMEARAERFADDHVSGFLATQKVGAPAFSSRVLRHCEMPMLSRRAAVGPTSLDQAARTAELTFSTGAAVERMDWQTGERYLETLSLDPAHVRLDRLNNNGPLLDSHAADSVDHVLGAVVPGSATVTPPPARAKVRFARGPSTDVVWQKVADGIIRSVSVGYRVYKFEETTGNGNALPTRKAVDWEPFELSLVAMPADAGAKVRANPCAIVAA